MGKWEPTERQGYHDVFRSVDGNIDWLTNNTGFDKEKALSYAVALNIVDAGVDLGEAVDILNGLVDIRTNSHAEDYAADIEWWVTEDALPFLQRIANAVEGDKTKEDV